MVSHGCPSLGTTTLGQVMRMLFVQAMDHWPMWGDKIMVHCNSTATRTQAGQIGP